VGGLHSRGCTKVEDSFAGPGSEQVYDELGCAVLLDAQSFLIATGSPDVTALEQSHRRRQTSDRFRKEPFPAERLDQPVAIRLERVRPEQDLRLLQECRKEPIRFLRTQIAFPEIHEPAWKIGPALGSLPDQVLSTLFALGPAEGPEDRVDESPGAGPADSIGQFHRNMDGRMIGNPVQKEDLVGADP
jgi:hypothetical protein